VQVYKDLLTGEEYYSDAKTLENVMWVDPDTKEEVDTGLVRCKAKTSTEGGGSVDVGGGNAFGGATADEGADDAEETKLDQFWNFPSIQVRPRRRRDGRRGMQRGSPPTSRERPFQVRCEPQGGSPHTRVHRQPPPMTSAERDQLQQLRRVQEGVLHALPGESRYKMPGVRVHAAA